MSAARRPVSSDAAAFTERTIRELSALKVYLRKALPVFRVAGSRFRSVAARTPRAAPAGRPMARLNRAENWFLEVGRAEGRPVRRPFATNLSPARRSRPRA